MLCTHIVSKFSCRNTRWVCHTNWTTHLADLPTLGSELVDLGFCDVSAFLSFFQLMLILPVPGQVGVGLLLLFHKRCVLNSELFNQNGNLMNGGVLSVTHRLLSLPLVGLHLQLQLVHQILESADILLVLLTLQEKHMSRGRSYNGSLYSSWIIGLPPK